MKNLQHAQTVLTEEDIEALKKKTGESAIKDAIAKAVTHYLECENTQGEDDWAKKLSAAAKRKYERDQAKEQ